MTPANFIEGFTEMSKPSELQATDSNQEVSQSQADRIPEHSRRELLERLRKAVVAAPSATALSLKSSAAFGEA